MDARGVETSCPWEKWKKEVAERPVTRDLGLLDYGRLQIEPTTKRGVTLINTYNSTSVDQFLTDHLNFGLDTRMFPGASEPPRNASTRLDCRGRSERFRARLSDSHPSPSGSLEREATGAAPTPATVEDTAALLPPPPDAAAGEGAAAAGPGPPMAAAAALLLSISSRSLCSSSARRAFCSPITCVCSSSFCSWSCSCFCCSSCFTRISCISRRSTVIDAPFTFTCCCTLVISERDGVFLASRDMVVREVDGPATGGGGGKEGQRAAGIYRDAQEIHKRGFVFVTWRGADEAAGQVGARQLLLQDGDDLLVEVLHGHGGDVPQLLQDLVRSLRRSGGVDVAQHAVDLVDHLKTRTASRTVVPLHLQEALIQDALADDVHALTHLEKTDNRQRVNDRNSVLRDMSIYDGRFHFHMH
ncbi:hypothetical protein EYF80_034379 [Liparis tanakae]|uniref:Uncharacterized protein n=1 Tax=Liparis tanakae TaxID=230148 RepID=A0A4Z2GPZ9_9TELE|nr:hypothetical protein EYF80_034379 [Liparis tanakae]